MLEFSVFHYKLGCFRKIFSHLAMTLTYLVGALARLAAFTSNTSSLGSCTVTSDYGGVNSEEEEEQEDMPRVFIELLS